MAQLDEIVTADVAKINSLWSDARDALEPEYVATLDWGVISENLGTIQSEVAALAHRCKQIEAALLKGTP